MIPQPRVVVFGSLNVDITLEVRRIPVAGETIVADRVRRASGGKGANQAYAAARAARGVHVLMGGAVGDDDAGTQLRADLAAAGVDIAQVRTSPGESGTAMIAVDSVGRNVIVVAPGANHRWTEFPEAPVADGDVLVVQLELPLAVVESLVRSGRAVGARVVLNAAPVTRDADRLLPFVDVLVVNEIEAEELCGLAVTSDAAVAAAASRLGVDVVVTLGADGAVVATRDGATTRLSALPTDVVDTVGAGDAFVGALAAALAEGESLVAAARRGSAAGALTVAVRGARRRSLSFDEIDRMLDGSPPGTT